MKRGRPPYLYDPDDVDPIVIERIHHGQRPDHMTFSERVAAVLHLTNTGVGVSQISVRLHMSGTRIHELRERAAQT